MKTNPVRVDKPWGYELIWANTDQYVGKILHVESGEALSLQYHEVKDETIYLLSGRARFFIGPVGGDLEELSLQEGESVRIAPRTVHRIEAITGCDFLEASTAHLGDLVRLEDRYGRVGEE